MNVHTAVDRLDELSLGSHVIPFRLAPSERPLGNAKGYPERQEVSHAQRAWEREFSDSHPPFYEAASVIANDRTVKPGGWADAAHVTRGDFLRWKAEGKFFSYEGEVRLDPESGRPLNPWGRTGICGRGLLGKWGANQAADALLTRENEQTGELEVLLIKRGCGSWAIPGGMLDDGEDGLAAMIRELEEEAGVTIDGARARLVYQGTGDGPRTTDNAWIETSLYHFHLSAEESRTIAPPTAGSDARDVAWVPVSARMYETLYANHGDLLSMALTQLPYHSPALSERVNEQIATLPRGYVLTSFSQLHGRIGIFGGTFDPIHGGHLNAAEQAGQVRNLDAIVYMPTQQNPDKDFQPGALPRERFEMVCRAVGNNKQTFVSPFEIRKDGASYTVDTLEEIRRQLPEDSELFFILGSDCLPHLAGWREIDRIRELATIVPIVRPGVVLPDFDALANALGHEFASELREHLVAIHSVEADSTGIRERLKAGEAHPTGLPDAVSMYIEECHLYGSQSPF